jgi:hypothetical protein
MNKYKNSPPKTQMLTGQTKKSKAIYTNIVNKANTISKNKYKILKEKENEKEKEILDKNIKNNSTGIRLSYKKCPYYLHSKNSIKINNKEISKNNNKYNKNIFKNKHNHLYHHNIRNNTNILKGKINLSSSYKITLKNDIENNLTNNHYHNNASYLNSKSVKEKNELYKIFSFPLNDDKDNYNGTQRLKDKMNNNINIYRTIKDIKKNAFKSYNYKMRGKPLNNYRGLKTEINSFKKIKFFSINNGIHRKAILTNRKDNKDSNDDLILKRNKKNNIKSGLCEDYSENCIFINKKSLFLSYSPYKSSQILGHNSFKNKMADKI